VARQKRTGAGARGSGARSRPRRVGARLAQALVVAGVAFLLATSLPVLAMRWIDPWTSAFMLGSRARALLDRDFGYSNSYEWVDLERITPHAAIAVIAAEDQLFPFHAGFDFKSIREAVRHNSGPRKRLRGASTISQQLAKNLFLWPGRSWLRKGLEAWFTVLIETLWPKERILEAYLNVAEFGRGVYGVEAAARRFYGKSAERLTRREAATLAAVLPNPTAYRVDRPSRYVLARRDRILGQMRALGGPAYLRQLDDETPAPQQPRR
jgi:monofunctional biosynthetic peptidoglycan transglycosylase